MKKPISRRVLLGAGLGVLAGSSAIIATNSPQQLYSLSLANRMDIKSRVAFQTVDEIIINRPVGDVFSFVTNLQNSDKISDHLIDPKVLKHDQGLGDHYSRKLLIHGFENEQIVTVTNYENQRLYQTSTELFGVAVVHTYSFQSDGNGLTKIQLVKQSLKREWADGFYQPFVTHQLIRPEHDGRHLITLKRAVETA